MTPGIIIENISKEELFHQFQLLNERLAVIETKVNLEAQRDMTLSELSRQTGYCKAQVRRILVKKAIPFSYEGRELVIKREDAGRIKMKKTA